ncbi:MAG: uracil-DNA glycosylase family protein [Candidatus Micrarchaeia archaeon]
MQGDLIKFEFSAGAFVYLMKEGKPYLLVLRREKDYDIPKGHIEKGETAIEAAKREVKEETGLEPKFLPYFWLTTKYFFFEDKEKVFKTVKFFIAESNTDKVTISFEHIGYSWLTYEEAMNIIGYKDLKQILPEVYDYILRNEAMKKLNSEYAKLPEKANSWNLSRNFVPGEGPLNAETMLVGQAPGRNEDEQLRPFVGRGGQLLDKMLKAAKIDRQKAYITSVVQFYPPGNRVPTKDEIDMCLPFLKRQIEIVKPKFVILLGNVASGAVIGISSVNEKHGSSISKDGITYFVTFHPAAALRFKSIEAMMLEDLKKFGEEIKAAPSTRNNK